MALVVNPTLFLEPRFLIFSACKRRELSKAEFQWFVLLVVAINFQQFVLVGKIHVECLWIANFTTLSTPQLSYSSAFRDNRSILSTKEGVGNAKGEVLLARLHWR